MRYQRLGNFDMSVTASYVQWREARLEDRIHICTLLQEQIHNSQLALLAGNVQRGGAMATTCFQVRLL